MVQGHVPIRLLQDNYVGSLKKKKKQKQTNGVVRFASQAEHVRFKSHKRPRDAESCREHGSAHLSVGTDSRIDHQTGAVPVRPCSLFDLGEAKPGNKQVDHRRVLHTKERQRDTKQTNKCASPYEEFWAA